MKNTKLLSSLVSLSLVFGMMTGFSAPASDAKSKKISLSKKTLTIDKGTKKTLKVKNTKKKVSFKIISGKKYISIKKKGKTAIVIKAKKVGKAKVLAKVAGKKLTCNIKVVKKTTNNNSKATNNVKATATPAGSASATTNVSQTPSATATSTSTPTAKATSAAKETATPTNSVTPTKDPNKDTEGVKAILEFDETGKIVTGIENSEEATYAEIPEGVTTIGEEAFGYCHSLKAVNLPKGITSIGKGAFKNSSLIQITIPTGVTKIEDRVFATCYELSSVVLPEGITSIGSRAFEGCHSLESIKIPDSVTSIGGQIFALCNKMNIQYKGKTHTIESFYKEFGKDKVKAILELDETGKIVTGCKNSDEATYAEIPEGITTIGEEAFYDCNTITNIVIPKGVTVIENYAFCDCNSLSSIVLPEGITSIGRRAFEDCYNLESIKIPDSVKEFGSHIFDYCDESLSIEYKGKTFTVKSFNNEFGQIKAVLTFDETGKVVTGCENEEDATYIEIPDGVTGISDEAFYHCYYISNIKIADSVTEFGINIFKAYTDEDEDEETTTIIEYKGKTYTVENFYKEFNIISGTPARFRRASGFGGKVIITCRNTEDANYAVIPDNVTDLADNCFSYAEELISVIIPDGKLVTIGDYAFYNCISLKNIKIPDSVTEFGKGIFDGCEELTSIEYKGQTYTTVESFYVAAGIKAGPNTLTNSLVEKLGLTSGDVVIPSTYKAEDGTEYTITELGDYAFENSNITSLTIPNTITSIGNWAFSDCENLKTIKLPESLKSIGYEAFTDTGIENITIPANVTDFESAFEYCDNLNSVTISKGISNISDYAFFGCYQLETVVLPEGLTSIGNYAFSTCDKLTNITLPKSLNTIGEGAFGGCQSLTSIVIPENVTYIGELAFERCDNLETVIINNENIEFGIDEDFEYGYNPFFACSDNLTIICNETNYDVESFCQKFILRK